MRMHAFADVGHRTFRPTVSIAGVSAPLRHGHGFWRGLDFDDFCRTIWNPFCVKKAKPAPSLKSGVRYTSTEKNVKFLAVDNFRQRGAEFWERPSRRHFMDPERYEKVGNRAKKVENFEVARAILSKIV